MEIRVHGKAARALDLSRQHPNNIRTAEWRAMRSGVEEADLFEWSGGLRIAGTGWYLDSRLPRQKCFVSHAHSDHLPNGDGANDPPNPELVHGTALCTPVTAAIGRYRCGLASQVIERDYFTPVEIEPGVNATLLPAGHVLGSAMLHVRRGDSSLLYTGDFKLRHCRTVPCAQPAQADVLVIESTFGDPMYRFPPAAEVEERLVELAEEALRAGKQPIVYGYSLGKSQEIVRILTDAGLTVTQHGAVARMSAFYEQFGVPVGKPGQLRRYVKEDFAGPGVLDLEERGVLVAPPDMARTGFTLKFGASVCRIMVTGWSLLKNAIYRYGVDHALPLSDHADFGELVEMIRQVNPRRILTTHGYADFPDHLAKLGIPASLARPPAQMRLF
jgi:Cft2 family RNA processing exonuclease